jgi:hypothetical protein
MADIKFNSRISLAREVARTTSFADAAGALRLLEQDRSQRAKYRHVPHIVEIDAETHAAFPKDALLPMTGTVALFLAPRGSEFLRTFENALVSRDARELRRLFSIHGQQLAAFKPYLRTPAEYATEITASGSYFDFGYGRKTLISGLALPSGVDFLPVPFPYNGGELDAHEFFLDEWFHPGKRRDIEILVVKTAPELSEIEVAALKAVPVNDREANLAAPPITALLPTTTYLVGVALWELGSAYYAYHNCCGCRVQSRVEDGLRALRTGAGLSARELTRMREQALLESELT